MRYNPQHEISFPKFPLDFHGQSYRLMLDFLNDGENGMKRSLSRYLNSLLSQRSKKSEGEHSHRKG